jgi:hypothetical protein
MQGSGNKQVSAKAVTCDSLKMRLLRVAAFCVSRKGGEMLEETKKEGETPEGEAVEKAAEQVHEEVKGETPEELKARLAEAEKKLANKSDEAARLHKKVESYDRQEQERKKAQMTETERLQAERDEALQKATEFERKQHQRDAAEKVGLPLAFADRLKGATPEELESDAKALLESLPKAKRASAPPSSPAEAQTKGVTDEDRRTFLFGG